MLCKLKANISLSCFGDIQPKPKLQKLLSARNSIDKKLQLNQKSDRLIKIDIKATSSKEAIELFWSNIWNKPSSYNEDPKWIETLERKYCSNTVSKNYQINLKAFQQVLSSTENNGTPSPDNITAYVIKRLPSTHTFLVHAFVDIFENAKPLPGWLVKEKTILLPKNQVTEAVKNYRPIACLNITYNT